MKSKNRSHSWLHPTLETREAGTGKGVFAKSTITKDDLVAVLAGHVMPIQEEPVFSDGRSDLAMQIRGDFVLGSKFFDELEDANAANESPIPKGLCPTAQGWLAEPPWEYPSE